MPEPTDAEWVSKVLAILDGQPPTESARVRLAWLMWCFQEGYVTAADRAQAHMTNWLLEDPATLHVDDAALRPHLLAMADEVLEALERTDGRDPTSMTGHAGTTTEHEVASPSPSRQPTDPTQQADVQSQPTTDPLSTESTQALLTGSVRVLGTGDLLALMDAIVLEMLKRWEEAERG